MPACNAAQTLHTTYEEVMAQDIVDQVIVIDDKSRHKTVPIAEKLPIVVVYSHDSNRGYGGNQKTCFKLALEIGGDFSKRFPAGVDHGF